MTTTKLVLGILIHFSAYLLGSEDDLFNNVRRTRRRATVAEYQRAIGLRGCAGTLIAPNVGLSAAHCRQVGGVASGTAMARGAADDGIIGRTLEIGDFREFDYWIFEIRWNAGRAPSGVKVAPLIQTHPEELVTSPTTDTEKIYTLGFPGDVSNGRLLFYAYGYAKSLEEDRLLLNNISLINGNSGGPIFKASGHRLVSIVSGGPHRLGQPGFKDNDPGDENHWNWGPALYLLYRDSPTLRNIFPDGHNRFDFDLGHFNQFRLGPTIP